MINLGLENNGLVISSDEEDFKPYHRSQLAYWGFEYNKTANTFTCNSENISSILLKLSSYFKKENIKCRFDDKTLSIIDIQINAAEELQKACESGLRLKNGLINITETNDFLFFLKTNIVRKLKDHQYKAALHLISTKNGANFSVPGSGKTTVVLTVFQRLKQLGEVDSLFVVGPPACFGPWCSEYESVLGFKPNFEIFAGGDVDTRHSKYHVNKKFVSDLYLTTFQTLQRDWKRVKVLFEKQEIKFFLVIDEAHYIKQINGEWANAVLNIAPYAKKRCVLTGTPFPRSYEDAFNLFDVLWPNCSPIPSEIKHQIELYEKRNENDSAQKLLNTYIGPLFYRVRKSDLKLAAQIFKEPYRIQMNKYERIIYDSILDRIKNLSKDDYFQNIDLLIRLRRGRMIRLRQCLSCSSLLKSAVTEYNENLTQENASLCDIIMHYNDLEKPKKMEILIDLVDDLRKQGEKVVIWSNFVDTLKLIRHHVALKGHGVALIYGGTPFQNTKIRDELSREKIINNFVNHKSGIDVLVANPAACAESISLHKTCSHAIYYDMSYNCSQYLQSLDRIHRVGGSENKPSYYHFLQYDNTIDEDILKNVQKKSNNMSAIIDKEYAIYSLDMFEFDEELEAYERLFYK